MVSRHLALPRARKVLTALALHAGLQNGAGPKLRKSNSQTSFITPRVLAPAEVINLRLQNFRSRAARPGL